MAGNDCKNRYEEQRSGSRSKNKGEKRNRDDSFRDIEEASCGDRDPPIGKTNRTVKRTWRDQRHRDRAKHESGHDRDEQADKKQCY